MDLWKRIIAGKVLTQQPNCRLLNPRNALQSLLFDTLSIQQQCRGLVLQGSTEYNLKGHIFRAHPNYRQEGPWYDYAMITWGTSPTNNSSLLSDSCNLEGTLFDTAVYDKTRLSTTRHGCLRQDS